MEESRSTGKKLGQKIDGEKSVTLTRRLPDWLDAFENYTSALPSPSIFKKWGGIYTLCAAMERKMWIRTKVGNLYPNLYVALVGPPGAGKTVVISAVRDMMLNLTNHHLAPSNVSRASLIDTLSRSARHIMLPQHSPPTLTFNGLAVVSNELGVFLPTWDSEFMNTLQDLYDAKHYEEAKRGKDLHIKLDHTILSMLAGTTVSYLLSTLPEGAWDQGFTSRTLFIYSGEATRQSLFSMFDEAHPHHTDLINDLKHIGGMFGRFRIEESAADALDTWHLAGGPPSPDHPKLLHYGSRRTAHLLKLCMVASVSRGLDQIITMDDYHRALNWLLEAETFMPDIFKSSSGGGDSRAIEDTYYWAYKLYVKKREPISEAAILEFLQNRVPAHSVERILTLMVKARIFEKLIDGYKPRPPKDV